LKGTIRKLTCHDTPEQNGVAEHLNRTLLERIRAMLHASKLPKGLWGEALQHATWLKNRTSTKALENKTPYEALTGSKPDLSNLKEWGTKIWVHDNTGSKLDGRAKEGYWVGFDSESKGSRVYWPTTKRVSVERNTQFDDSFVDVPMPVSNSLEGERVSNDQVTAGINNIPSNNNNDTQPIQPALQLADPLHGFDNSNEGRPQRLRKPSAYVKRIQNGEGSAEALPQSPPLPKGIQTPLLLPKPMDSANAACENLDEYNFIENSETSMAYFLAADLDPHNDPRNEREALSSNEAPMWRDAMIDELRSLEDAGTWIIVNRPANANVVGSKWVFRRKRDATGKIIKYKARLVAQGFTQTHGVDFHETYAPVAKLTTNRIILALAARNNWEVHQIDIKNAYLNTDLEENVYMRQPPGFEIPGRETDVCLLQKALYGLRQSGNRWYDRLSSTFIGLGYGRCETEYCVFYKSNGSQFIIVVVAVDDLTLASNSLDFLLKMKKELAKKFEFTDAGDVHWLLGIEIKRNRKLGTIALSQRSYIDMLLERFNLQDANPLSIPMEPSAKLSVDQCPTTERECNEMKNVPYREIIGSLMYAALATRPDISFVTSTLGQFMHNPGKTHWEAAKRVLRYLKGTRELELVLGSTKNGLTPYTDADHASQEHRHSIMGYAVLIDGGAISWSSKKQPIVALSTTEAEYIAAAHATKEVIWIRTFLAEITRPLTEPTMLLCDNQSAIALTQSTQFHARTKHIDIRYHFIREAVSGGVIELEYCPTNDMVADALTKPLARAKLGRFTEMLGLRSV
jgi:hypothetical protein